MLGAVSITESQSGSDAADIRLRAEPYSDGYRLNGTKQFVTGGSHADLVVVLARIPENTEPNGLTCFLVPASTDGFKVVRVEEKLGISASGTASIALDDVVLGPDHILGGVGEGLKIIMEGLAKSRIGIAAQAVGIARAAFALAAEYTRSRESFSANLSSAIRPSGIDSPTWRHRFEAARQLVRHAAVLVDSGGSFREASSMAKLFAGEMVERVVSDAIQAFGGYGYLKDYPLERLYRDARIGKIYEGTSDIQRMIIANHLAKYGARQMSLGI